MFNRLIDLFLAGEPGLPNEVGDRLLKIFLMDDESDSRSMSSGG